MAGLLPVETASVLFALQLDELEQAARRPRNRLPRRRQLRMASGKRAAPKQKRQATFRPALALLALGVTACVVAWGYLVWAAIDFGTEARGGDEGAWTWLGVASLGGVACLFAGLMLVARLLRALGITNPPPPKEPKAPKKEKAPQSHTH